MKLNKNDIKHIARLARLDLTEEEMAEYGEQLSSVLGYIDQLKEVDTSGVEPTAQVTGFVNGFRDDEVKNWDETERDRSLNQAPEIEDNQVKVKRVL